MSYKCHISHITDPSIWVELTLVAQRFIHTLVAFSTRYVKIETSVTTSQLAGSFMMITSLNESEVVIFIFKWDLVNLTIWIIFTFAC